VTSRSRIGTIIAFVLPAGLLFFCFVLLPILQAARYALFDWNLLKPDGATWAAGRNFSELLRDGVFWKCLGHNGLLAAISIFVQLPLALGLALLLAGRLPGRGVFRTLCFAPMVMPTVAVGFLWRFVYDPQVGLLEAVVWGPPQGWLGDPNTTFLAVVIAISWRFIGFHTVIFLAGLESIPPELYEAAEVDGASRVRQFRRITLPLLLPAATVSATLSLIGSLKYFDLIYVLFPEGSVADSSEVVATYMYRTVFRHYRAGYGSLLAVALFVIVMVVSALFLWGARRRERLVLGEA